jgi:hypothetical protein
MKNRDQVAITRLRTGYSRAIHGYIINRLENMGCLFCNAKLTVDHILWDCKETKRDRQRMEIQKEKTVWRNQSNTSRKSEFTKESEGRQI